MKPAPDVTLIIATWNRVNDLRETLRQVSLQDTKGTFTFQVIVADNNSSDDTRLAVESFQPAYPVPLHYVFEKKQGKSFALNTALRSTPSPYIAFTDDDCFMGPDWLLGIWRTFQEFDADGVGGPVYAVWKGERPDWFGDDLARQVGTVDHGDKAHVLTTHLESFIGPNCAYRRKVFEKIGGYDTERLGNSEDVDLFIRAFKAGFKLVYQPAVRVGNKIEFSPDMRKTLKKRFWRQGRAIAYGVQEEGPKKRTLCRVPLWMVRYVIELHFEALAARLRGDRVKAAWHWLRRYFYLGAIYYCFEDWRLNRVTDHGRPEIPVYQAKPQSGVRA